MPIAPHCTVALLLPLLSAAPPAQRPQLPLVRAAVAPVIDGALEEAAWTEAAVIDDLRQVEPVEGAAPTQPTEIRILYDEDAIYFGVRCFDDEPGRIVATQLRRDASLDADDRIELVIDPYFDRRNGFLFSVNPLGARRDALIEANSDVIDDWDGIWYARAAIDGRGWTAEIAIPFKTISFDPGTTRWSFNLERTVRRINETSRWSAPRQNKSITSLADAGVLREIRGITQGLGLDVVPFAKATYRDDDTGDVDRRFTAGLDVFYKLSPSMTLALTANTDFAETEVDERQVNLTRFPLFFPEKRDFFLQDAGIFEFGGIRRNPLPFFSRRIGLDASGRPIDILGGAKLTGRTGALNVGALTAVTGSAGAVDEQVLSVVRPKVNVLEESTVGLIATFGDPLSNDDNAVVGGDFDFRTSTFGGDKVLEGNLFLLHSSSTGDGDDQSWGFKLGYPNDTVNWSLDVTEIGERFDAALGFVPRRGIREYIGRWRYRWRPRGSWIRTIDAGVRGELITDLGNETETSEITFDLLEIRNGIGDEASLEVQLGREVLDARFEIRPGIEIAAGDYRFNRVRGELGTSDARPVSFRVALEGGEFFDGDRLDAELEAQWRVSPNVFVSVSWEQNDVDLPAGAFQVQIARARLDLRFNPDVSWTNFIQWDSVSDSLGINSRLRWILEPGNEVFLVINQAFDTRGDTFASEFTELTTKVGWTFRF